MSKIIQNYLLKQSVGQGQYGKVFKATHIKSDATFAVQVIKLQKFKMVPKLHEFTVNQIQTLSKISNPNVIQFVEMLRTSNNVYLVYQFCNGGTLEDVVKNYKFLSEKDGLIVFQQIRNSFKSLFKQNILHRDLKPSNILLHDGVIKVADFGFCKTLLSEQDLTQTMVGSPIYMAPEILQGCNYNIKADIWSMGVVLFEILFGYCPYEDKTIARLISQIDNKKLTIPTHINKISKQTEQLLHSMLTIDPTRRIEWTKLLSIKLIDENAVSTIPELRHQNFPVLNEIISSPLPPPVPSSTSTSSSTNNKNSQSGSGNSNYLQKSGSQPPSGSLTNIPNTSSALPSSLKNSNNAPPNNNYGNHSPHIGPPNPISNINNGTGVPSSSSNYISYQNNLPPTSSSNLDLRKKDNGDRIKPPPSPISLPPRTQTPINYDDIYSQGSPLLESSNKPLYENKLNNPSMTIIDNSKQPPNNGIPNNYGNSSSSTAIPNSSSSLNNLNYPSSTNPALSGSNANSNLNSFNSNNNFSPYDYSNDNSNNNNPYLIKAPPVGNPRSNNMTPRNYERDRSQGKTQYQQTQPNSNPSPGIPYIGPNISLVSMTAIQPSSNMTPNINNQIPSSNMTSAPTTTTNNNPNSNAPSWMGNYNPVSNTGNLNRVSPMGQKPSQPLSNPSFFESMNNQTNQTTFKFLMRERNKILFQIRVMNSILDMNDNELSPYLSFLTLKSVKSLTEKLKETILEDGILPESTKVKYEKFENFRQSQQYQIFLHILSGELDAVRSFLDSFQEEIYKCITNTQSPIVSEFQIREELNSNSIDKEFFQSITLKYLEILANQIDIVDDLQAHQIAVHQNQIADSFLLEDYFDNENSKTVQQYFTQLTKLDKRYLSQMAVRKIDTIQIR